jgi:hypothetical protein
LEKDLANAQENHGRETEDWKKFQADLQTAVRVANDFMTGKFKNLFRISKRNVRTMTCSAR